MSVEAILLGAAQDGVSGTTCGEILFCGIIVP